MCACKGVETVMRASISTQRCSTSNSFLGSFLYCSNHETTPTSSQVREAPYLQFSGHTGVEQVVDDKWLEDVELEVAL